MLIEKPKPVVNGKQICVEDTVDRHGIEKKFILSYGKWYILQGRKKFFFGC